MFYLWAKLKRRWEIINRPVWTKLNCWWELKNRFVSDDSSAVAWVSHRKELHGHYYYHWVVWEKRGNQSGIESGDTLNQDEAFKKSYDVHMGDNRTTKVNPDLTAHRRVRGSNVISP